MKYQNLLTVLAVSVFALAATPVLADSLSIDFESYTLGNINGQDGWMKTGPYDAAVVSNTYGFTEMGTQALRVSNGVTSGSFGDQTFAKPLVDGVGEVDATSGSYSVGTKQTRFETEFDFATTVSTHQAGLFLSVSPDRGDGSRMSYLGFSDQPGGIDVIFYDVAGTTSPVSFVPTTVATGLSRSEVHKAKLVVDVVDGPSNDVVQVYIDDALVHTGTSWENYYRYDNEASAEQSPRVIKTVLFRAGGTAVPANSGNGFLFDNINLTSSTPVVVERMAEITAPTVGQTVSGSVNFAAYLVDDDADSVQWAVRQGTCAAPTGTVFGNVDGKTDVATLDQTDLEMQTFNFTADMSASTPGVYCFVYNPAEDSGETNIRETVEFNVEAPVVVVLPPTDKDQCKKDGWKTFTDPVFKNQGQCVSYVVSNRP